MPTEQIENFWQIYRIDPTPSLNQMLRYANMLTHKTRMVRGLAHKIGQQHLVGVANKGWRKHPICPAEVMIIRTFNGRDAKQLDSDNLLGGCKYAIDALRKSLIIADDSASKTLFSFFQYRVDKHIDSETILMVRDWDGYVPQQEKIKVLVESLQMGSA